MQSNSLTPQPTFSFRWAPSVSRSTGWFHRIQLYRVSSTGGVAGSTLSPLVTCLANNCLAVTALAIGVAREGEQTEGQVHHQIGVVLPCLPCDYPGEGRPEEAPLVHLLLDGMPPVDQDSALLEVQLGDREV